MHIGINKIERHSTMDITETNGIKFARTKNGTVQAREMFIFWK